MTLGKELYEMSVPRTLFIPCSIDGLPKDSGSIRLRAMWQAKYMPWAAVFDGTQLMHMPWAAVFDGTQLMHEYDAFIFQKAYLGQSAQKMIAALAELRELRYRHNAGQGLVIGFDLCDQDYLDGEHLRRMEAVLPYFDFATAPTQPIVDWLGQYLPAHLLPDRVDPVDLPSVARVDSGGDKPRVTWAGYAGNQAQLLPMSEAVARLGLSINIWAVDQPVPFHDFWTRIALGTDILLNPRPTDGPLSAKSDNKTLIAWAMGIPVARTVVELEGLLDPRIRKIEADTRRADVLANHHVRQSAQDMLGFIDLARRTFAAFYQSGGPTERAGVQVFVPEGIVATAQTTAQANSDEHAEHSQHPQVPIDDGVCRRLRDGRPGRQ